MSALADGVDEFFVLILVFIMKREKLKERALFNFWDLPKNLELINNNFFADYTEDKGALKKLFQGITRKEINKP